MNKHVKTFFHRGALFAGFGPIIMGLVYVVLSFAIEDFSISGSEACMAIISTYIIAFVQAGASVFNQIEHWPIAKSLFFHFTSLYLVYTGFYLVNFWIPFEPMVLLIFTAIFVAVYFATWLTVYISVKVTTKRLNKNYKTCIESLE